MATIRESREKGVGGGKKRAKRVSRSWMIKTILSQQSHLDNLSQLLAEAQGLSQSLLQEKMKLSDPFAHISTGGATEIAPSGSPERLLSDEEIEHL